MKKLKSIPVYILVLCSMFVVSCSEDKILTPAILEEELDTISKYNWSYDELGNYNPAKIYIADSNNIYIAGYPYPLYFNGIDYLPINIPDPNFSPVSIDGYDKENVFIGGAYLNNSFAKAQLVKVEGNSITVYPELDDSTGSIGDMQVDGPNEAWLISSEKNYIYRFSNGQFTKFTTDARTEGGYIYRTQSDHLYLFTLEMNINSTYLYTYVFENNAFRRLQIDTVCLACDDPFSMFKSENLLLKLDKRSIYYFNENDWTKICDTKLPGSKWQRISPRWITGSSKDNLICYSYGFYTSTLKGIYIWNGNKWSWEKSLSFKLPIEFDYTTDMQFKDDKVYLPLYSINYSILLKGYLKKF